MNYIQIGFSIIIALVVLFMVFQTFTAKETRRSSAVILIGSSSLLLANLTTNNSIFRLSTVIGAVFLIVGLLMGVPQILRTRRRAI